MVDAKLIKKLHLRKGHQYILFISGNEVTDNDLYKLNADLRYLGFSAYIVYSPKPTKIKVVEQKK